MTAHPSVRDDGSAQFGFVAPARLLSANDRNHYHANAPIIREWRSTAARLARIYDVPTFTRPHVTITIGWPDRRHRDVGNYASPTGKAIVDGLVDAGRFRDDCDCFLIGPDMRRGPKTDTAAPVVTVTIREDA